MEYARKAGFPSSHNARFLRACWDEFSVDAGMANLSGPVVEKLKDVVDANTIVLARHNPNDRPFVERFFGVLEETGFHRLPNTTGSSPKDPRRKNPELAAIKYSIQLEQLEDLIDVLIANSNSTPHGGIGYRTPLEYLESLCAKEGSWPRQADPSKVERILSFYRTVSVRGGTDTGRRPFVTLFGVKYSSDVLKQAYHLLGKKLSVEINRRDLRTVRAYTPGGAELGILRAAPPWHLTPHTLEMRQVINSLAGRKVLNYVEQSDPVMALLEHLEKIALQGKIVPPLYLEVRKLFTQHLSEFRSDPPQESIVTIPATKLKLKESESRPATSSIPKLRVSLELPLRRKTMNG
jgi:hypothetical protein